MQREEQVRRRQRDAESDGEVVEQLHLPLRPDRDGEPQPENEDAPGQSDQHQRRQRRSRAAATRAPPTRRRRSSSRIESTSPRLLDGEPEDHQACGDEDDRPPCRHVGGRKRPRGPRSPAQALHKNDGAEPEQDPAQQPRHIAGAHAQRGADRIIRARATGRTARRRTKSSPASTSLRAGMYGRQCGGEVAAAGQPTSHSPLLRSSPRRTRDWRR